MSSPAIAPPARQLNDPAGWGYAGPFNRLIRRLRYRMQPTYYLYDNGHDSWAIDNEDAILTALRHRRRGLPLRQVAISAAQAAEAGSNPGTEDYDPQLVPLLAVLTYAALLPAEAAADEDTPQQRQIERHPPPDPLPPRDVPDARPAAPRAPSIIAQPC